MNGSETVAVVIPDSPDGTRDQAPSGIQKPFGWGRDGRWFNRHRRHLGFAARYAGPHALGR
ncbi:MAG: hypothetical protein HY823_11015 [Acidobacteria bacterium]|nr:hypothetical protein [Acidobacteriota bacterium]